jgi:membrane protease YdiL (CAAX protease family)
MPETAPPSRFSLTGSLQAGMEALGTRAAVATILGTLLLITDAYHQFTPWKWLDRTFLYLLIPLAVIMVVFQDPPSSYGMVVGDWRAGLLLLGAGAVVATPVVWFGARSAPFVAYYRGDLQGLPFNTLLDLAGWEFFFRGFLLFAYAGHFGPDAIWLQAMPFALAHIGKPEMEALSTIFGGLLFGWMAYRTRSVLYPLLLHWFVGTLAILVAAGRLS